MDRLEFLKLCGLGYVGAAGLPALLAGCATSSSVVNATMTSSGLQVPLDAFESSEGEYRSYIIARNETLQYPIYIKRTSATDYTASLMRCTHKGVELQVAGEKLTCPAHGSQFTTTGAVIEGPADKNLKTYPVSINGETLVIQLS
jgi:Rieske Fe-S protein